MPRHQSTCPFCHTCTVLRITSGQCQGDELQAAAIELVEQAQMGEGAYLKLKSVVLQPPSPLVSPGPSACLAGWLDLPPSPPDGPLMVGTPFSCMVIDHQIF